LNYRANDRMMQAGLMACDLLLWGGLILGGSSLQWEWSRWRMLLLAALYFTLVHSLLHAEARYRLPLLPLLCIAAGGVAGYRLSGRRASRFRTMITERRVVIGLVVLVVLYGCAGVLFLCGCL
jgi:hypothetical protein